MDIPEPCPSCGGNLILEPDCPGYLGRDNKTVMVCCPPCGNAYLFTCDSCTWWYRLYDRGLLPLPFAPPMASKPDWVMKYADPCDDIEDDDTIFRAVVPVEEE